MRTRLARLLLAAARRVAPPELMEPAPKPEPEPATRARVAHYLADLGMASGGAILGPPSRPADAKLSEGGPVCPSCGELLERDFIDTTRAPGYPTQHVPGPWFCPNC